MKIRTSDASTKKPLTNTKLQLQVRGKDSGYLTVMTDSSGTFELDDKYKGQQIAYYLQGGSQGQWITANDGATLTATSSTTTDKSKQTTQSYK